MSSSHNTNGTGSHKPLTRTEAKRLLEAVIIDVAGIANQLLQQDGTASDSLPSEPPWKEATKRLDSTTTNGSHPGFENPSDRTSQKTH